MPHAPNPLLSGDDRHFYSTGFLCERLQKLPGEVWSLAEKLGIEHAIALDGIPYYATADVRKMQDHIRQTFAAQDAAAVHN